MKPKPPYALFWKDKDMADTKKKTGLYFGSFNPVHAGHLIVAEHIAWHTDLDQVWLVVSPHNPFKEKSSLASDYDRLEMVNLAIEEFHIDKKRSWFIGDSSKDVKCAEDAGVKPLRIHKNQDITPVIDQILKSKDSF